MKRFDFSNDEYNYFLKVCPFTDEEIQILELRRREKSIEQIAMQMCLSDRTVQRRISSIAKKISKEIK